MKGTGKEDHNNMPEILVWRKIIFKVLGAWNILQTIAIIKISYLEKISIEYEVVFSLKKCLFSVLGKNFLKKYKKFSVKIVS